jgi:cell division protein FtsZ
MDEVGKITDYLQNMAGFDADLIWGNGKDETLGDDISVTLIATGFGNSSIPEITGDRKPEKETHELKMESEPESPKTSKKSSGKKSFSLSNQKTLSFNDSEDASDDEMEFEVLYPKTNKARKNVENAKMDFSSASDEDLDELENIPAYKRRQMRMNDPKYKKKLSNYSVNNENKLTDKNSYLHGQVD